MSTSEELKFGRIAKVVDGLIFSILLIPSAVLVGWVIQNEILKRVFPGIVEMNPVTAVCFLLFGGALWCISRSQKWPLLYRVGQAFAVVVALVTGLMALKYVINIDLQVDRVLFTSQLNANRMAPNTTLNFILMSLTILGIDFHLYKKYWFSYICLFITFTISVLVLIGYVYNFAILYRVATFIPMALHTAITFLLCCLTVVFLRPQRGLLFAVSKDGALVQGFRNLKIRTKLTITFGVLIVLLLFYSVVTYLNLNNIRNSLEMAQKSAYENKVAQLNLRLYEKKFLQEDDISPETESFYLRGKDNNVEQWRESHKQFLETYQKIEEFESKEKLLDLNKDQELADALSQYHDGFLLLVEKQRQLGFFMYGYIGKARDEVNQLALIVTDPQLKASLLELRRQEKNFFLRNDESAVQLFTVEAEKLDAALTSDPQKERLKNYVFYFNRSVELKKEIGLSDRSGLRATLENSMSTIEPIVNSTRDLVATVTREKIAVSMKLTLTLSFFFVLLGLAFAYVVSELVAESINHIRDAALRVMQGKDLQTIPIETQDEVGQLAQALNVMTGNLKNSQNILEEKNLSLAKSIDELNLTKKATLNVLEDLEQSKKKIEQEKAKDEAILSSIGDGVIVTDAKRVVLFVNVVAEKMIGWSAAELKGKVWGVEVPKIVSDSGDDIPDEQHALSIALNTRTKAVTSYAYVTKSGARLLVGVTASPVILSGELVGAIVVFRDVTKEHEVDRMKTEFISLASHQLRTPLTAMKWFSEMLLSGDGGELTQQQREFVQNISDSNERMVELVNSLLNISRIESGRLIIEPKMTSLKDLLEEVLVELRPRFEAKKQQLIVSVHHDLPLINVDPKLIRQVYSNLLTNALKYTPEGGEISIFISQKNDDIVSQVSDTGYGIPLKEQGKVFQKFYRGENIIPIETDGTGLGLYLIKVIIESSGGKIWFESTEKVGTSFYFSIPMSGMVAKKGEVRMDQ